MSGAPLLRRPAARRFRKERLGRRGFDRCTARKRPDFVEVAPPVSMAGGIRRGTSFSIEEAGRFREGCRSVTIGSRSHRQPAPRGAAASLERVSTQTRCSWLQRRSQVRRMRSYLPRHPATSGDAVEKLADSFVRGKFVALLLFEHEGCRDQGVGCQRRRETRHVAPGAECLQSWVRRLCLTET